MTNGRPGVALNVVSAPGSADDPLGFVFFRPGQLALLLTPTGDKQSPLVSGDLADLGDIISKIPGVTGGEQRKPFHENPFQRAKGEPPAGDAQDDNRAHVVMARGKRGVRVLQTVNLASWDPGLNALEVSGENIEQLQAPIGDVGRIVRGVTARLAQGTIAVGPYTLEAVSPNWLAMPFCVCGFPAGRPAPPPPFAPGKLPRFRPRRRQPGDQVDRLVREYLDGRYPGERAGEGVQIAIFDTWPLLQNGGNDLARLREFQNEIGEGVNPRLDEAVRGGIVRQEDIHADYVIRGGAVRVHRLDAHEGQTILDTYPLPDHGLFVADIIKDIAPAARLMVYRVLDDYGVGDLHLTGQAIEAAIGDAARRPGEHGSTLVLNLSLGVGPQLRMVMPVLENAAEFLRSRASYVAHRQRNLRARGTWKAAHLRVKTDDLAQQHGLVTAGNPVRFTGALHVLEHLFGFEPDADEPVKVLAVAAAGNDSRPPATRFWPRLPAALVGVLGVSAIHDTDVGAPASYSNADDLKEPQDGIGAFGGEKDNGLIGLFVSGHIPENAAGAAAGNPPNPNGWAQWCGTSFAAPIVAGLAACIWSEVPDFTPGDVLEKVVYQRGGNVERPFVPLRQQWQSIP